MKEFIKVHGASDGSAFVIPTVRIRCISQEKDYTYIELGKHRIGKGTYGIGVKESVDEICNQLQGGA